MEDILNLAPKEIPILNTLFNDTISNNNNNICNESNIYPISSYFTLQYKENIIGTIYEDIEYTTDNIKPLIRNQYKLCSIQLQPIDINIMTLLNNIIQTELSTNITEEDKKAINIISSYIQQLKNTQVNKNSMDSKQFLQQYFIYLYYINMLLPIFANNRIMFKSYINSSYSSSSKRMISHDSFHFEYMITLWSFISHIYNKHVSIAFFPNMSFDQERKEENETYEATGKRQIGFINKCIDLLNEMLNHINRYSLESSRPYRFVYKVSPLSISNTTYIKDNIQEDETNMRLSECEFINYYFGTESGIQSRISLMYAKKYETIFYMSLKRMNIDEEYYNGDLLGIFSSLIQEHGNNDNIMSQCIHIISLAHQISSYFNKTAKNTVKSIDSIRELRKKSGYHEYEEYYDNHIKILRKYKEENDKMKMNNSSSSSSSSTLLNKVNKLLKKGNQDTDDELKAPYYIEKEKSLFYLTSFKSLYWYIISSYIQAKIDYYDYHDSTEIFTGYEELGRQSLKRLEQMIETITHFGKEYFNIHNNDYMNDVDDNDNNTTTDNDDDIKKYGWDWIDDDDHIAFKINAIYTNKRHSESLFDENIVSQFKYISVKTYELYKDVKNYVRGIKYETTIGVQLKDIKGIYNNTTSSSSSSVNSFNFKQLLDGTDITEDYLMKGSKDDKCMNIMKDKIIPLLKDLKDRYLSIKHSNLGSNYKSSNQHNNTINTLEQDFDLLDVKQSSTTIIKGGDVYSKDNVSNMLNMATLYERQAWTSYINSNIISAENINAKLGKLKKGDKVIIIKDNIDDIIYTLEETKKKITDNIENGFTVDDQFAHLFNQ